MVSQLFFTCCISGGLFVMLRASFFVIAVTVASSTAQAAVSQLQQFGSVEIQNNGSVVETESSNAFVPLELQVGHTFNEAELRINLTPAIVAPVRGVDGQVYVSASSLPGEGDRFSEVIYDYEFQLHTPADYFVRHFKQGDSDTTLSVTKDSDELISLMDPGETNLTGRFDPGNYNLSIDASAFRSFTQTGVPGQDFSQLSFILLLEPVPEPTTLVHLLAGLCLVHQRYGRR